ncbi:unnamed protein product [Lactuca saligna]|uniref:Uncharacterized protein n=1 Tax=Lactuca saligna TaxID=75948 RepID=A0AA35UZT0_LACSI|nr:unnamed protein product [Lactuca saligna]
MLLMLPKDWPTRIMEWILLGHHVKCLSLYINHSSIKTTNGITIQISNKVKRCISNNMDTVAVAVTASIYNLVQILFSLDEIKLLNTIFWHFILIGSVPLIINSCVDLEVENRSFRIG